MTPSDRVGNVPTLRASVCALFVVVIVVCSVITGGSAASARIGIAVGPFSSFAKCDAERKIWRNEGYSTDPCYLMDGSYYFMAR